MRPCFVFLFLVCASLSAEDPVQYEHHGTVATAVELEVPAKQPSNSWDVRDFGALADGYALDTPAIRKAVKAASDAGGGYVVVPRGRYLISYLNLASGVYLWLDEGSVLLAAPDVDLYDRQAPDEAMHQWYVVGGQGLRNTGILGHGTLDGQALEHFVSHFDSRYDRFEPKVWDKFGCRGECRPDLVRFERSENILIRGVTITNSARWTVHLYDSNNILIEDTEILGDLRFPNNDGVDLHGTENVTIRDSHISVADDGICLKGDSGAGPVHNTLVYNVKIRSKSSAIKVGSNVDTDIHNAYFRDILIYDSNRGLGIQQVGYEGGGDVFDFTFENISIETRHAATRWWGNGEPIWILSMPRREGVDVGQTRNITFRNIRANSENGILIAGREGVPVENLLFEDVHVIYDQWTLPVRPHREYTAGDHPDGGRQYDRARGVWLEHVKGVTWKDSSLTFNPATSEFFGACQGGFGIENQDVRGLACLHPEKPASTDYARERATRGNW